VVVEFNSLSKAYNMGGWRLGMAVGNPTVLRYLHIYKSQADNSHFAATEAAGAMALTGDQSWIIERNDIYKNRRDIVLQAIRECGFTAETPKATIYVWAKLPENYTDCVSFCDRLLNEAHVSMTPGRIYGHNGCGYIRISLGTSTERIEAAMERLLEWRKKHN
ncbi:MAG: aminotransferase class I/II-fold pyridoxal phosphate-dependent enzyme, partial [Anaerolineaceae bacterium]|nr:aminotransferase class I/II-fold pyridoxal phosphate-dependent enzyme [Anaerolineaceae bacterium]